MSEPVDAELVSRIVTQVLAALRAGGAGASANPAAFDLPSGAGRGLAEPPPRQTGKAQAHTASTTKEPRKSQYAPAWEFVGTTQAPPVPTKVFITAEMLQHRLAAGTERGAIELAPNEFLTPAASDLADQSHLTVRRAQAPIGAAPGTPSPAAQPSPSASDPGDPVEKRTDSDPRALGLLVDRPDEKVRSALSGLVRENASITNFNQTDCWVCNLESLCQAVAAGRVRAGIAMMPYAADAMVLANKVKGVRAVQGTRAESVAAALRHFSANVLILEHAFSTLHEIRAMVRLFAAQAPSAPPPGRLTDAIGELEKS